MKAAEFKQSSQAVQEVMPRLEADLVGVASLAEIKDEEIIRKIRKLLPSANSMVMIGMEIYPEFLDRVRPQRVTGAITMNDLLERHMEYLGSRLNAASYTIARTSHKHGLKAMPLPAYGTPSDTRFLSGAISLKHAAVAAGLGMIGHSGLFVSPQFGPRVRLAACITEAELEQTAPPQMETRENCVVCIKGCPAHAISEPEPGQPYLVDRFACSVYRNAAGGCSECMRLCPRGH